VARDLENGLGQETLFLDLMALQALRDDTRGLTRITDTDNCCTGSNGARETVGGAGVVKASIQSDRIFQHDGGQQMLVQHEPDATSRHGEPESLSAAGRLRLRVEPWHDPVIDEVGYDPRSDYVERFWLPVLGPSTTWLLRHFTIRLEESPAGVELDVEDTARSLGLGERLGPNAPFARTLKRCVDFEMAEWRGPQLLAVRIRLPPLARRHLRRLPESLQVRYEGRWGAPVGSVDGEHFQGLPRDGARARRDL
jgi:hypothetical protein